MMRGGGELHFASGSGWQAVELPYVGDQLAMDIHPAEGRGGFGAALDSNGWGAIVKGSPSTRSTCRSRASAPKRRPTSPPPLSAMGMPDAFTASADSRAHDRGADPDRWQSSTRPNIDVDENGTTAAPPRPSRCRRGRPRPGRRSRSSHPPRSCSPSVTRHRCDPASWADGDRPSGSSAAGDRQAGRTGRFGAPISSVPRPPCEVADGEE